MLSQFTNNNYKVLASAQITITDQTDAANLAGNISVINSTKNQIYLLGSSEPFVPNWEHTNLVLKPFMIASSIYLNGSNPDLFDPFIYSDLNNPTGNATAYIKNITWYKIDQAGNKKEITSDDTFAHEWTYSNKETEVRITDKRQLVIKKNFLERNETATILCNFSFYDPYANIAVPVSYSIDVTCLSTGSGATRSVINPLNGTSFYNNNPEYLNLLGEYYSDGIQQDLQKMIETDSESSTVKWSIRSGTEKGGWKILDPQNQDQEGTPTEQKCYEVHRLVLDSGGKPTLDPSGNYVTEKTNNMKGGVILKVFRGLIAGSDVIKLTVEDGKASGSSNSSMEVLYDYSDPTRVEISSSNGDKLVGGITGADKTEFKAVVTHEGILLEDDASNYNTDFDYYWFRSNLDASQMHNMYLDDHGAIQFMDVKDPEYTQQNGWPKAGARKMAINRDYVDKKNTFMLDLVDKRAMKRFDNRETKLYTLLAEEDLNKAKTINVQSGVQAHDVDSHYATAFDLKAQEESIKKDLVKTFIDSCKTSDTEKTDK